MPKRVDERTHQNPRPPAIILATHRIFAPSMDPNQRTTCCSSYLDLKRGYVAPARASLHEYTVLVPVLHLIAVNKVSSGLISPSSHPTHRIRRCCPVCMFNSGDPGPRSAGDLSRQATLPSLSPCCYGGVQQGFGVCTIPWYLSTRPSFNPASGKGQPPVKRPWTQGLQRSPRRS